MPSVLLSSLASALKKSLNQSTSSSSNNERRDGPDIPWNAIGSANEHLLLELRKMYWDGVRRELAHILLTLHEWQQSKYSQINLEDEKDDLIHGYDTFLDQVSYNSRVFAQRYRQSKKEAEQKWRRGNKQYDPLYTSALQRYSVDIHADRKSESLKADVRKSVEKRHKASVLERRARMLLQSAGFLDIDKLIEHRPPLENLPFWKRPPTPQLTLTRFEEHWVPSFGPLQCTVCREVVRGSFFHQVGELTSSTCCESCFRKSMLGSKTMVKSYKHCILREAITDEVSRQICRCSSVPRRGPDGRFRTLFPIGSADVHHPQCGLLNLTKSLTQAKYEAWLLPMEKRLNLSDEMRKNEQKAKEARAQLKATIEKEKEKGAKRAMKSSSKKNGLRAITNSSLVQYGERVAITESTATVEEKEANEDIPPFMRPFTNRYPFGNVHMTLRVGPLLIENGVKHSKGGALVTNRDPPNLQVLLDPSDNIDYSLAISESASSRLIWSQNRTGRVPRRYKATMKQIVGGAFCGFVNSELEQEIISDLIRESREDFDDPGLPIDQKASLIEGALARLLSKIKLLLNSRVERILNILLSRFLDPATNLTWDQRTNNCQKFCDSLLSSELLSPLLAPIEPNMEPLYLMSFVCRPGSYVHERVRTKFDVPNGQIEEYLLKFRFGRHDEADIVDTLQEYWHDWGAFGNHIYKYQDLFPWDCTEAYGRYPVKCNDCNLAKHVWSFPFDSWSIVYLHLARDRAFYPPIVAIGKDNEPKPSALPLSDADWMRNRLTVLLAQDVLLAGAVGMARSEAFRNATTWLKDQPDPRLDRLKLGGIHRAQPFSHHFEKGAYRHYFLASWAHLRREDQIAAYELLRDGRVKKKDVSRGGESEDGGDAGDGGDFGGGDYGYYDGMWFYDASDVSTGGVDGGATDADAGLGTVGVCPEGWDGEGYCYPDGCGVDGQGGDGQGGDVGGDTTDGGTYDGGGYDGGGDDGGGDDGGGDDGGGDDGGGDDGGGDDGGGGDGCGGCGGCGG